MVTIRDIERGISQQERRDPSFAGELPCLLDRMLPGNVPTARRLGQLSATPGQAGVDLPIAVTALE